MLLGHGTSSAFLATILKEGIKPRGEGQGNWERCPSGPDRVYLSDAYAFYFAQRATKAKEDLLVMEVEVDEANLLPDEDFLGHITAESNLAKNIPNLLERTVYLRDWVLNEPAAKKAELTKASLQYLGNAAHLGVIAPEAIKRFALIPYKEAIGIVVREFDPIIAPINYRFMGENHRAFQVSLFERFPFTP